MKKLKQLFSSKKGVVAADKLTDKLLGVVIFITVLSAMVPTVLASFTNLSGSGIALATLFTVVGGILLAVFAFKGIVKGLK